MGGRGYETGSRDGGDGVLATESIRSRAEVQQKTGKQAAKLIITADYPAILLTLHLAKVFMVFEREKHTH